MIVSIQQAHAKAVTLIKPAASRTDIPVVISNDHLYYSNGYIGLKIPVEGEGSGMVPHDALCAAVKAGSPTKHPLVIKDDRIEYPGGQVSHEAPKTSADVPGVIDSVISAACAMRPALRHYDFSFIATLSKIAKTIGVEMPLLVHGPTERSGARVIFPDTGVIGMIMPHLLNDSAKLCAVHDLVDTASPDILEAVDVMVEAAINKNKKIVDSD